MSPEVFDSASRIALRIPSCSSLLRNALVRIVLPTRSRAASAKATASAAESAKPAATATPRRPAATAATDRQEHGTAAARGITPSDKSAQPPRHDDHHDHKYDEDPDVRIATTTMVYGYSRVSSL